MKKQLVYLLVMGGAALSLCACAGGTFMESSDSYSYDSSAPIAVNEYDTSYTDWHTHWHHHYWHPHYWHPSGTSIYVHGGPSSAHYVPPSGGGHFGPPAGGSTGGGHFGPPAGGSSGGGHFGPPAGGSSGGGHFGPPATMTHLITHG